jgi:protein-tyrosine phosphatase
MIDIHCHILPGIDDGAADLDASITMAAMAVADGIHTIIATPHVGAEVGLSMAMITNAVEHLNCILRKRGIALRILPGAEVASHVAVTVADQFCLASGTFFLLEFPYTHLPADCIDLVYTFVRRGLTPIIAHPERNQAINAEPKQLLSLIDAGARIQITASSLTGELGPDACACSRFLLKNDMVHFLATDSHSPNLRRPILSKAVKKAKKYLGKEGAHALVADNPLAILSADSCR